jgi:outer membrane protein assembly factor BamB
MKNKDLVFVGIKGTAIALSRTSGEILWETYLKGSGFVHLVLEGEDLFATTQGEVFCLDPATGEGRWNNELKGYGWGLTSIAVPNGTTGGVLAQVAAAEELQRSEQASSAAVIVQ